MSIIRAIPPDLPFDDTEDHIHFTRGTIKADPNASHLLPMTDDWLPLIDAVRAKDRQARIANADATAARVVSNFHFDHACTQFGDDLFLAVAKDRESARWTQFFPIAVSRFIKMRFDKQIQKVKAWLAPNVTEPVLDKHRPALTTWSNAAVAAVEQTSSVAMIRAAAQLAREQLAEDLTRERDGLYEALAAIGRAKNLPRDWPKQFFRVDKRNTSDSDDTTAEANAPETAPGG
jgi:hypothetical protein